MLFVFFPFITGGLSTGAVIGICIAGALTIVIIFICASFIFSDKKSSYRSNPKAVGFRNLAFDYVDDETPIYNEGTLDLDLDD